MKPASSIIINNYNYARFLNRAVDSALAQTARDVEVIVVDDGSTDHSLEIIASYGDRIRPVMKENGGQGSAYNAGFEVSRGRVVQILDADDMLMPNAVERILEKFEEPGVVKVHWPQIYVDADDHPTGGLKEPVLPDGDLRAKVLRDGPAAALPSAPTSGNAYLREKIAEFMPMPAERLRMCSDAYLFTLAPVLGVVRASKEPLGYFRKHGANHYQYETFEGKLRLGTTGFAVQVETLQRYCRSRGIEADVQRWLNNSWWPRAEAVVHDIATIVPEGDTLIFVDGDQLEIGRELWGRKFVPFLERDGGYWGPPPDDATAISELQRLRATGIRFIAFAFTALWWLDHFPRFHKYLLSNFREVIQKSHVVIFDMNQGSMA